MVVRVILPYLLFRKESGTDGKAEYRARMNYRSLHRLMICACYIGTRKDKPFR